MCHMPTGACSNKEIFLCKTISNVLSALNKIHYVSLMDPSVLGTGKDPTIKIVPGKENKVFSTISIGVMV